MTQEAPPPPAAPPEKPKTSGLAIASLICGIVALPLSFCMGIGILAAVAAVVLAIVAKKKIAETGVGGSGMATAGLIIGIVAGLLSVIFIIMAIMAVGTASTEFERIQLEMQQDMQNNMRQVE